MTPNTDIKKARGKRALSGVVEARGRQIRFALDDPEDEIQRYILNGEFYECDQLAVHQTLIPRRSRILDLGANVGNHSIYYALVCEAESVVAVEPNSRACRLFSQTLKWNRIDTIDFHASVAVGAGNGWAVLDQTEALHHNLGGTSITVVSDQCQDSIPVLTGDAILDGREVDFIKIDVEGSELQALVGLQRTIYMQAPVLAVEVMPANRSAFFDWCDAQRYRVERTFQMYRGIMNYICLPSF